MLFVGHRRQFILPSFSPVELLIHFGFSSRSPSGDDASKVYRGVDLSRFSTSWLPNTMINSAELEPRTAAENANSPASLTQGSVNLLYPIKMGDHQLPHGNNLPMVGFQYEIRIRYIELPLTWTLWQQRSLPFTSSL
jgi:hypothetical protein